MKATQGNIAVGIDIGSYNVKVIIAAAGKKENAPRVLGVGYAETKGLRHGYIIHQVDAIKSIRKAVRQAERMAGIVVKKAFVSVGGVGLASHVSTGSIVVSRADSEVTEVDIEKVIDESQANIPSTLSVNRKIIHVIPTQYKIDGKEVYGNPVGMKGARLEVKTLFVTVLEHHLNELIQAIEDAGVDIIDVMAAPLASSLVTLNKSQKIAGCVLVNIGSETVSLVVHEDGIPISLEVFPMGSNDITNDIALGLKISLEEAEMAKRGEQQSLSYSHKDLENIVHARLGDIFDLVEAHLKKINKNKLLPAGIILTGGGAHVSSIDQIARDHLSLPSRVTENLCEGKNICDGSDIHIQDATWAVSYGLTVFGLHSDGQGFVQTNMIAKFMKNAKNGVLKWIKQFLP